MADFITSKNIEELDNDYPLICKEIDDIINDINFEDKYESDKCRFIIEHLEDNIAKELKNKKAVSLPFVGVIRYNLIAGAMQKHYTELRLARRNMTKDDYIDYFRNIYINEKDKINSESIKIKKLKLIRKANRKKYLNYIFKFGKYYADTYIYTLSLLKEIPFDQEIQDKYDEFNNRESNIFR